MIRRVMLVVAAAVLLALPAAVMAHEGHAHKVMGTIESIAGNHLTVKTTDGKSATVMIDAKTKITRGKATVPAWGLKVGERVVAEGAQDKTAMVTATTLRLGTAQ